MNNTNTVLAVVAFAAVWWWYKRPQPMGYAGSTDLTGWHKLWTKDDGFKVN
jgi:hypothetical protein